jgi:nucleoside phosphorylase
MRKSEDYTIAWICHLDIEYVSAQACLDETLALPEYFSSNTNEYTAGRIGNHYIVISLPRDRPGNSSSAAVAVKDLLRGFHNIRVALTVGVGDGLIVGSCGLQLGDVVVNTPSDRTGGLIQFDFDLTAQKQRVYITGLSDPPSRALRVAVSQVRSTETSHQLEETIEGLFEAQPELRQLCRRPSSIASCGEGSATRKLSADVYYGSIASSTRKVDSISLRDLLKERHQILCSETGAFGLATSLPLLAVRGISDYMGTSRAAADWQPYAAIAAAAYTKNLICTLVAGDIEADGRLGDIFQHTPLDLDTPSIRLVRLFGGDSGDIACEVFEGTLDQDSMIPYEALSYASGTKRITQHIIANGKKLLIASDLHYALYNLRKPAEDRILWVDAICIDGTNMMERGHHARHMGDIFKQAERALFWLGEPTDNANVLLDSLSELQQKAIDTRVKLPQLHEKWMELWKEINYEKNRLYSELSDTYFYGYVYLIHSGWFKRIWALQELSNARTALFCCGTRSIGWQIFSLAPRLVGYYVCGPARPACDLIPGPLGRSSWNTEASLYTLLRRFRGSKAQDPRDLVYAVVGISSDAKDVFDLLPDYAKSVTELIHDVMAVMFPSASLDLAMEVYQGMSFFLRRLPKIATHALRELMLSPRIDKAIFKKLQEYETKVTKAVVIAAVSNSRGSEAIKLLLEWDKINVTISPDVIMAAVRNRNAGKRVVECLLNARREGIRFSHDSLVEAAKNVGCGYLLMKLIIRRRTGRFVFTADIISAMIRNRNYHALLMEELFHCKGNFVFTQPAEDLFTWYWAKRTALSGSGPTLVLNLAMINEDIV